MKTVLAVCLAAILFAALLISMASATDPQSGTPGGEHPLVSEGKFAVELATALNLTRSHDEAAAERELLTNGITPRNGWISDFPMTPEIIAEVRRSAADSASSGMLGISVTEVADIVDKVSAALKLHL
jgi:hypothetical protein